MNQKKNKSITTISRKVISKIKEERIIMRPKFYFILKGLLLLSLTILIILISFYISSLIVFIIRTNNILLFPSMGLPGWQIILKVFPWYLLILSLILIILLEIVFKKFAFVYRRPLIYSLALIVMIVISGSLLIEIISFHDSISKLARQNRLPIVERMYGRWENIESDNIFLGSLLEKEEDYWVFKLETGEIVNLDISQIVRGREMLEKIREGKDLIVIGEIINDQIIEVIRFRRVNNEINRRDKSNSR